MEKTVAGLFQSSKDAHEAADDLMSSGFSSDAVSIVSQQGKSMKTESASGETRSKDIGKAAASGAVAGGVVGGAAGLMAVAAGLTIPGIGPILAAGPLVAALAGAGAGAAAGGIIGALVKMGIPKHEAHTYAEGVRRGGILVSAHTQDPQMAERAATIMNAHNAADIDRLAADWKQQGWTGFTEDQDAIPMAKEELKIGKREVGAGAVRIYSRVEETPVEQEVSLHEEHARIERQPVSRPVNASDNAFQERSFQVQETAEEPVIQKDAYVTEEVRLGREASEHRQQIHDTLRHTELDVERDSSMSEDLAQSYPGTERRLFRGMPYTGPERRHHASM